MSQKHKFASLLSFVLLASLAWSQNPNSQGAPVSTTILALPVTTLNAVPVRGANLQLVGVQGQTGYCYWAVANFQVGSLMSALGCVSNAPNTLSVSNYIAIYPFSYPPGATIDILRTGNTFTAPAGACNCAVATGLTGGGTNDQSNSLSSYTVSIIDPNQYAQTLSNEVISPGVSHLILRQGWPWPKTFVCDLSIGCGSAPGISPHGCQAGLGDGATAITAGSHPQYTCTNAPTTGASTWTLTSIRCWTDNAGSSTLAVTNNAGTALLTGPITCSNTKTNGGAAGTQSATVAIPVGDALSFTFVADGVSTQTNWTVTFTQ